MEWDKPPLLPPQPASPPPRNIHGPIICPLCGTENGGGAMACRSCGAALQNQAELPARDQQRAPEITRPPAAPRAMQSWKMTAGLAVMLFFLVLIGIKFFHSSENSRLSGERPSMGEMPQQPPQSQNTRAVMAEIDDLQKKIDANPGDAVSILRLANRLQDAKMPERAIGIYRKYLSLQPQDADATTDMGVCYFDLASTDSSGRADNLASAQQAFQAALAINPGHQLAQFNLGIVNLMAGDLQTATACLKKAVALDPKSETGKRAQMLLDQHSFTKKPS